MKTEFHVSCGSASGQSSSELKRNFWNPPGIALFRHQQGTQEVWVKVQYVIMSCLICYCYVILTTEIAHIYYYISAKIVSHACSKQSYELSIIIIPILHLILAKRRRSDYYSYFRDKSQRSSVPCSRSHG